MLLQDLVIKGQTKLDKINKFLSSKYGIKLSENTSNSDLMDLKDKVEANIHRLRVQEGKTPKDPEFAKELLILEGVNSLMELELQEPKLGSFREHLDQLVNQAISDIQLGHAFEQAMYSALQAHRSSPYVFQDDVVEKGLRDRVGSWCREELARETGQDYGIMGKDNSGSMVADDMLAEPTLTEDDDLVKSVKRNVLKSITKELADCSIKDRMPVARMWETNGEDIAREVVRSYEKKGLSQGVRLDWSSLERDLVSFIGNKIDTAEYDLGPDDVEAFELDEAFYEPTRHQVKRGSERDFENLPGSDKSAHAGASLLAKKGSSLQHAKLEPMDSDKKDDGVVTFQHPSVKRKLLKNGKVMNTNESKENYVKRLRMILENEVVQAEVLAAAKSFGQEFQVMIEKIGRLTNEDLEPVVEQMRGAFGPQEAIAFQDSMRSEMEEVLNKLRVVKEMIDESVEKLAAGGMPGTEVDMDADLDVSGGEVPSLGDEPMDQEVSSDLDAVAGGDIQDEFGGAEEEEPLGRPAKESVEVLKNQLSALRERLERANKQATAKK